MSQKTIKNPITVTLSLRQGEQNYDAGNQRIIELYRKKYPDINPGIMLFRLIESVGKMFGEIIPKLSINDLAVILGSGMGFEIATQKIMSKKPVDEDLLQKELAATMYAAMSAIIPGAVEKLGQANKEGRLRNPAEVKQ